ncbi:MAG: acriflavin resistance protein [Gammaproteobacteria bacterium]|nr:MAG: acriflavin resistance protein [Gammaproteobacteria bacterium]
METLTFRQPRLVVLILLVIISAGLSSFLSLGRQEDPTITNIFAIVTTAFPGADPARVEALVTEEIETELEAIAEVDIIKSVSRDGVSVVSIELIETLDEDTIEQVWSEARDAVEDARRNFPPGVLAPEFDAEGIAAYSAVIAVSAEHDDVPLELLSRHAESLGDVLRSIPSTRAVDLFGVPEEEVLVELDLERTTALGLGTQDISSRILAADAKVPSGRLQHSRNDLGISVSGEIEDLDRLRDVVLRTSATGTDLRLADVGKVTRGARMPAEELAYANGQPAVLIGVLAQDGVQIDRWLGWIRDELASRNAAVPAGITETLLFDQSTYTLDRLGDVVRNMAIGIVLVVVVLLCFLGIRAAAIVAIALPIVSLATLASMNAIGLPIHQMSVSGLIVALGLLVDAAIVMCDEVRQRLNEGMSRESAVGRSVRRLAAPLFASTVTTALAFTPMILLPGPAGDFVGSIAMAVVLMLMWSFVIALTVTPALAGWLLASGDSRSVLQQGLQLPALARGFGRTIEAAVRHPLRAIPLALVVPLIGFAALPTLTAQFFPGVDRDQFYVEIDMAPGSAITDTERVVREMDAFMRRDSRIESVYWSIGRSGPAFYYNIRGGRQREPGYAQAMIKADSDAATRELVPLWQEYFDTQFPEARVIVRSLVQGPPVDAPVEIRLQGPDTATLLRLGDEASALIADLDLVTQTRTTMGSGAPEIRFDIDEGLSRQLELDLTNVGAQLDAGLVGLTGGSLVEGNEQLPVRVRFGDDARSDLASITDMPIVLPGADAIAAGGELPLVPLSALATPVIEPAESVIRRRDGERINTVQAFIVPDVLPEEALADVIAALDESGFSLPPGYRLELGGDSGARSNTIRNLLASVGLIVTLLIASIALTFNSFRLTFVSLVVCGLSAGLSLFALAVFRYPFGITGIFGMIGCIGVSINAAIIILTGLKADAAAVAGDYRSMSEVVLQSSRHIFATTITTFGGFLPLILDGGGFWPPFAMAIAGGVLLSSVVSFYFVPPMFSLLYRRWFTADRHDTGTTSQAEADLPS